MVRGEEGREKQYPSNPESTAIRWSSGEDKGSRRELPLGTAQQRCCKDHEMGGPYQARLFAGGRARGEERFIDQLAKGICAPQLLTLLLRKVMAPVERGRWLCGRLVLH